MGRSRSDFSALLKSLPGVVRTYFQPPTGQQMEYPCITYEIDDRPATHADNRPYLVGTQYLVTVIAEEPDNPLFDVVAYLPTARFQRAFPSDDLNHQVFTINY